ncbi:MAG: pantetheine-phosphate adenylyltransferase [Lachnospiraceae bacterium]|nr:pantetheine-phosphate adenylyltransferase [Lachnospiraceae bacterium]
MIRAIYPGSFDPVTLGHLDIIKRASQTVDELIVGVLNNGGKTPLFSIDERVSMLLEVTEGLSNVKVLSFSGLLVDFARQMEANIVVRGLRAISDFEYELQMAQTNHKLNPQVDTMFLATSLDYSYLSSTIVKEVAFFHGDISEFVPGPVVAKVQEKVLAADEE